MNCTKHTVWKYIDKEKGDMKGCFRYGLCRSSGPDFRTCMKARKYNRFEGFLASVHCCAAIWGAISVDPKGRDTT